MERRARAEAEQQKLEAQKRKKQIKTTAILCAIVAISLPPIIENAKTSKRESYVEKHIQKIIIPLEREMENATGVDITIDYYFSLENDWDDEQWYRWTFSVGI